MKAKNVRRLTRLFALSWAATALMRTAQAGPPFISNGAATLDPQHFEIDISAQYTKANGAGAAAIPSVEVDYGVIDKLQIGIQIPIELVHIDGVGTNIGPADTQMGVKYRFVDSDDEGWRPGIAFAPVILVPSGSQQRGLGSGHVQGFLPVWLSKDFHEWSVFGGGGYNINLGADRLNWWFTGLGVTRDLSAKWTVGAEVFHTTPIARGTKDSTGFNVGAIYNVSNVHHLMAAIGRNLVNARENNEVSVYLGYQATF
jgi:hypothetical protein